MSAHRQRKDAPTTVIIPPTTTETTEVATFTTSVISVTMPSGAVEPNFASEWDSFIALNGVSSNTQIISNYVVYLVFIITLFQRLNQIFSL